MPPLVEGADTRDITFAGPARGDGVSGSEWLACEEAPGTNRAFSAAFANSACRSLLSFFLCFWLKGTSTPSPSTSPARGALLAESGTVAEFAAAAALSVISAILTWPAGAVLPLRSALPPASGGEVGPTGGVFLAMLAASVVVFAMVAECGIGACEPLRSGGWCATPVSVSDDVEGSVTYDLPCCC